jgi:hypothetical protein
MRNAVKLGLAALTVCLLLSAAVGAASARNISLSSQSLRATWSRLEWEGGLGTPVRCQVTLEGSFHSRTIAKVIGSLIGLFTRATVKTESCTNGKVTFPPALRHITWEGFAGTLPLIVLLKILLRLFPFSIERPGGLSPNCVYGNSTDRPFLLIGLSSGTITSLVPEAGNRTSLVEARNEEFFGRCPTTQEMRGGATDGATTVLNSTTRITVTLI